jgi:hypothetical protein
MSYGDLPVSLTERECSQSICIIKLLTRALRALGNPALTSYENIGISFVKQNSFILTSLIMGLFVLKRIGRKTMYNYQNWISIF